MRRQTPDKAEQRTRDLSTLSAEMGHTLPPIIGRAGSCVIVVENRQEFLTDALEYVPEGTPVAAVGVSGSAARPFLYAGEGTDIQKMAWIANWVVEGRLAGPILLHVPPHRAWLINGLLQQALRVRGVDCESQAMDIPQEYGVDPETAIYQAQLVFRALTVGDIDRVPQFESGAALYETYQRLMA